MKKLIAFDLDDTLAITKSPMSDKMCEVLTRVLEHFDVCVISGGRFEQFQIQVIEPLKASPMQLRRLHLMPTCGTRYYRYNETQGEWEMQYSEDLTDEEKNRITEVLTQGAKELKLLIENPAGEIIEDRGSQVTFSALGQQAAAEDKYAWDADGKKKKALRDYAAPLLPDLEVRAGGTTSVDVTKMGIDKAYGMKKLMDILEIGKDDILFMGDMLGEGGNDYPVKAMGIDCLEVDRWEHTALALEAILHVI